MINDFYNFVYIAILMVGLVALTFTFLINTKVKDALQKRIEVFFLTIFIYMVADFATYYFMYKEVSGDVIYGLITASDILSIVMIAAWLLLLIKMAKAESRDYTRIILIFSGIYLVLQEGVSIVFGDYMEALGSIEVAGAARYVTLIFSLIYYAFNGIAGIIATSRIWKGNANPMVRTIELLFSISFVIYTLWLTFWDYSIWFEADSGLATMYAMDPILLIYVILCIAFLIYFRKKDPLKLSSETVLKENVLDIFGERYGISNREMDVVNLINDGKSNAEIAEMLCISENTVKKHINSIMRKSECRNRHELLYRMSNLKEIDRSNG